MYSIFTAYIHLALAISIFDLSLLNKHLAKFILSFNGTHVKGTVKSYFFLTIKETQYVDIGVQKIGQNVAQSYLKALEYGSREPSHLKNILKERIYFKPGIKIIDFLIAF